MAARRSQFPAGLFHREGVPGKRDRIHDERGAQPSDKASRIASTTSGGSAGARSLKSAVLSIVQQDDAGSWSRGSAILMRRSNTRSSTAIVDGSIAAAGGEVTLPTGKETEGLGGGVTIFEAFGLFGQALPHEAFVQVHAGFEWPTDRDVEPNSDVLADRYWEDVRAEPVWPHVDPDGRDPERQEFAPSAETEWDLVPQMQMTLSVFQHVRLDVGVRLPVNERQTRSKSRAGLPAVGLGSTAGSSTCGGPTDAATVASVLRWRRHDCRGLVSVRVTADSVRRLRRRGHRDARRSRRPLQDGGQLHAVPQQPDLARRARTCRSASTGARR